MKSKKDIKACLAPVVKVIARTSVFWNPMEAAILGLDMGTLATDDMFD